MPSLRGAAQTNDQQQTKTPAALAQDTTRDATHTHTPPDSTWPASGKQEVTSQRQQRDAAEARKQEAQG